MAFFILFKLAINIECWQGHTIFLVFVQRCLVFKIRQVLAPASDAKSPFARFGEIVFVLATNALFNAYSSTTAATLVAKPAYIIFCFVASFMFEQGI